jgi:hypothetical protein
MEPEKINSLTHKLASRADVGAAPAARAGASLAAVHLIESALDPDAGTGKSPQQPDLPLPHARAQSEHTSAPVAASGAMAPTPLPPASVEQESGVHVALSTLAIAAAANPNIRPSSTPPLPAAQPFTLEVSAVAYPFPEPLPATPRGANASTFQENHVAPALAQARDAERLAGLVLIPETTAAPSQRAYDVLVLVTVIVGALLLIFL